MSKPKTLTPKILAPSPTELAIRQRAHDRVAELQYGRELRYDRRRREFRVLLRSGVAVTIPVAAIGEFAGATPAQLAEARLIPTGGAIEQRELDVDLSLPGLLRDVLGFGEVQQHRAARVRTPAKAAAARANGVRGGRPRKDAARALDVPTADRARPTN